MYPFENDFFHGRKVISFFLRKFQQSDTNVQFANEQIAYEYYEPHEIHEPHETNDPHEILYSNDLADITDNDTIPLAEHLSQAFSYQKAKDPKPQWDIFRLLPKKPEDPHIGFFTFRDRTLHVIRSIIKVAVMIVCFLIALGGCIVSKSSFLFMTSQLQPRKEVYVCPYGYPPGFKYKAQMNEPEMAQYVWMIVYAFWTMEIITFLRASKTVIYKGYRWPYASDLLKASFFETISILGMALLAFVALPHLDAIKGAMVTNCMAFLPGVLGLMSRKKGDPRVFWCVILDLVCLATQFTAFFILPDIAQKTGNTHAIWALPLALILTSVGWWENYVDAGSIFGCIRNLARLKDRLFKSRHMNYVFLAPFKMCMFFMCMLFCMSLNGVDIMNVIPGFTPAFTHHLIKTTQVDPNWFTISNTTGSDSTSGAYDIVYDDFFPFIVLFIHIVSSLVVISAAKFACKIGIQGTSFALPLLLAVPGTMLFLKNVCDHRNRYPCYYEDYAPDYLFWSCPKTSYSWVQFMMDHGAQLWTMWIFSQAWLSAHIINPKSKKLSSSDVYFVKPMYNSFCISQFLTFTRRRHEKEDLKLDQEFETHNAFGKVLAPDTIPMVFGCATMWHETRTEMVGLVRSIFRMDADQRKQHCAQKYTPKVSPDMYDFEAHIFFDDAFEVSDHSDDWRQLNGFVMTFMGCIQEAGNYVHQANIKLRPPIKTPTPYGGRLMYILPGKTRIFVHLKDKLKIRHKKRWSQVMYMYYLLGWRLMDLPINLNRKEVRAENTFLLALDGDVDFHPKAVSLLLQSMKNNENLAASCGRIHPVGWGPLVWYQLFEYAIGHWFQKAAEHVMGCVLCSPGCFSLFRAKALMDDNVMRMYTTKSEEPLHYVQYDQGEDRWLCTLLLQRGYRVGYCAASEAYTHAPEEFGEFFNQRRRWVPSTMANIFDLLYNSRRAVRINEDLSYPYVFYQSFLMLGTIIGPGTIFLMLVGACVSAFGFSNWQSFYYNFVPLAIYVLVCLYLKTKHQLWLSLALSTAYGMVMMAVIVGTALQLKLDGPGSPSAVFLITLSGSFFTAALLHPEEFWCIVPGLLYLLCIPAMYLLLIIYSIANLHIVSWGTREVAAKKTKKEIEEEKKAAKNAPQKVKESGILGFILSVIIPIRDFLKGDQAEKINEILRIVSKERRQRARGLSGQVYINAEETDTNTDEVQENQGTPENENVNENQYQLRDDLINPYWIEDPRLGPGHIELMGLPEIEFWDGIIGKYLYPIDSDKRKEAEIAQGLKTLRNRSTFWFVFCNALFVLIVFMLTLKKDQIYMEWPFAVREGTILHSDEFLEIDQEFLHLEPIGLVLVVFFFLIISLQFICMLIHRYSTFEHILAHHEFKCGPKPDQLLESEEQIEANARKVGRAYHRILAEKYGVPEAPEFPPEISQLSAAMSAVDETPKKDKKGLLGKALTKKTRKSKKQ